MMLYHKCGHCQGARRIWEYEQGPNATHSSPCPTCKMAGYVPVAVDREAIAKAIASCVHLGKWVVYLDEADAILQLLESGGRG